MSQVIFVCKLCTVRGVSFVDLSLKRALRSQKEENGPGRIYERLLPYMNRKPLLKNKHGTGNSWYPEPRAGDMSHFLAALEGLQHMLTWEGLLSSRSGDQHPPPPTETAAVSADSFRTVSRNGRVAGSVEHTGDGEHGHTACAAAVPVGGWTSGACLCGDGAVRLSKPFLCRAATIRISLHTEPTWVCRFTAVNARDSDTRLTNDHLSLVHNSIACVTDNIRQHMQPWLPPKLELPAGLSAHNYQHQLFGRLRRDTSVRPRPAHVLHLQSFESQQAKSHRGSRHAGGGPDR